jgi:hypothetical protein
LLGEWAVVPAGSGRDGGDAGIGEGVQCIGVCGVGGVCPEHERDGWLWGAVEGVVECGGGGGGAEGAGGYSVLGEGGAQCFEGQGVVFAVGAGQQYGWPG